MISFSKKKHLSRIRIFIIVLASAGLFCLALPVIAQESLAPLNPDFLEYFQRPQISEVQRITAEGYPSGFIPPPLDPSHLTGQPIFQTYELAAAPPSFDLRTLGKVTPVRDQGNCGSCWTFATYGSLESDLLPSETWDFSENNLKNTHGFDSDPCEGGNGLMSTAYLARWSGPVSEADDPYNPSSNISPSGLTVRKHIQEVLIIPGRANSSDNDNIKQAVMTYGALTTSMYIDTNPASSYYNPIYYTYYYNGTANTNHAVAIVGWDDNFDKNKFSTVPPGNGAFIIKNSWGTGWGENGYFYISYYDTLIGKYNYMFNSAEPTTDYSRVYQYDPLGLVNHLGYVSTTAWFANIFIASATELLSAVSFYTPSPNSSYEIYVYTNVTSGPTSGSLAGTGTGTIAIPGYHTIPLAISVSVASGQKFSVAVRLTTPGYNYPIPIEKPIPSYSSQATAQAGESYISNDGINWKDITVSYPNTNVCVKAFTIQGPNLTPYQPSGWSDKIVVSKVTGTDMDSSPLYTTDMLYVDWAVLNDSTVAISTPFYVALYIDGVFKTSWLINSLDAHYYVFLEDYSIGSFSAGTHTIKIVTDSTGVINESNESDNEYSKTITVTAITQPNLTPYKPTGWSDKIVVSTTTGTNIDSTPIYPTDTLYVDWAVINNGTAATAATFYTKLYVDGVERQTWSIAPPLNVNYYISVRDYPIGTLSAGTHTIKIVADSTNAVDESNETDNEYTKTVTVFEAETITTPTTPSGSTSGNTGTSYSYTTGSSTSNLGHSVQYRFDWGDGTYSDWLAVGTLSASKSWNSPGTYSVKVKARCSTHTSVESSWSGTLSVNISVPETVSTPNTPSGPTSGFIGTSFTYSTGGSSSNLGHSVEYQFDWKGDGTDLSLWGSATQSKTWTVSGTYQVRARARCTSHSDIVSSWSNSLLVGISTSLPGDCNVDGRTTIDEVRRAIKEFLGIAPVQPCNDLNGNGQVTIDEVRKVINAFLGL